MQWQISTYFKHPDATLKVKGGVVQLRKSKWTIINGGDAGYNGLALFRDQLYAGYSVKNSMLFDRREFHAV